MTDPFIGRTIALVGDSGTGKTTQAEQAARWTYKTRGLKTRLNTCDRGGYAVFEPLIRLGIVEVNEFGQGDDPFWWTHQAAQGTDNPEIGLEVYDSGTSIGDILLKGCSDSEFQIGQQRTQKFQVRKKTTTDNGLTVAINNEAHYGVVQGFGLNAMRESTWLTRKGRDVIWTFAVFRGEAQDRSQILGPKFAGKALTPFLAKEFNYMWMLNVEMVEGDQPIHSLYTTQQPDKVGLGYSFGNIRCPLGVTPPLAVVRPASIIEIFNDLDRVQIEAEAAVREELGL